MLPLNLHWFPKDELFGQLLSFLLEPSFGPNVHNAYKIWTSYQNSEFTELIRAPQRTNPDDCITCVTTLKDCKTCKFVSMLFVLTLL